MRVARVGIAVAVVGALVGAGAAYEHTRDTPAPRAGATPTPSLAASPTPTATLPPAFALGGTSAAGQLVAASGAALVLESPLRAPELGSRVNAVVIDAVTGTVLYRRGSAVPVVPASTAKLATGLAALHVLGADTRFPTRVVARGQITAGRLSGDLILVGGGDPTLASPGAKAGYPPPARVGTLVTAVRQAGITSVTGAVLVDSSLFTGPRLGPGWKATYVTEGSVSPITALMVDGGRRDPDDDKRYAAPDLAAGALLRTLLTQAGVRIGPPGVTRTLAPPGGRVLATVESPPVSALVERLIGRSDNELAESLLRHVARRRGLPADFTGAARALRTALGELGLAADVAGLVDASGLSRQDRLTVGGLVRFLRAATRPDRPQLRPLLTGLPVAGFSGTLGPRYREGTGRFGAGRVRAKTGSLDNVSTLAGTIVTAGGRLLLFAFSADRLPTKRTSPAAKALDVAAAALARCGCPA